MSHLRYPEDLFKAQRQTLAQYHVTNASEFYGQQDFWQVPPDPTQSASTKADGTSGSRPAQPPHYLTLQMPDEPSPRFTLSTPFIPANGQNVLTGFLAVDSETGDAKGKAAADFGKLTLLNLPSTNPVNGPGQVQATFNSDPNVSKALNLLKSGNSEVINGNLLTLPVGGGLLYVQPVYLQSSASGGGTQYPLLQEVLVSFGDRIGFAPTLDQALDEVFGGDSGANAGDAGVQGQGEAGAKAAGSDTSTSTTTKNGNATAKEKGTPQQRLDRALTDMDSASQEAQKAMKNGDWAAYGKAQKNLQDALKRAMAADKALGGTATPKPSDGGGG